MFDVGFSELLMIAVVALIVLGPERLPKAARFAGLWIRRARAQWHAVKSELENEIATEDLRRSLEETRAALRETQASLRDEAASLEASLTAREATGGAASGLMAGAAGAAAVEIEEEPERSLASVQEMEMLEDPPPPSDEDKDEDARPG
jgi:sec-independent protein translocase protein TatB